MERQRKASVRSFVCNSGSGVDANQKVSVFYGFGGLAFSSTKTLLATLPPYSSPIAKIHFGRLTDDPYPDLIYPRNSYQTLISLSRDGSYTTPVPLPDSLIPYANDATLVDMDGDGFSDLVFSEPNGAKVLFCDGDGGFSLTNPVTSNLVQVGGDLIIADVNKDGYPDILAKDFFSGSISVFRYNTPGDATLNASLAISYLFDSRDFTFTFRNAFTPDVVATKTLDSTGIFTIDGLKAQTYTVHVVGSGFLGRNFKLDLGAGGTVTLSTALPMWCGDINGDNAIDFGDLSELLQSYNALVGDDIYVLARDLNGDGGIDFGDLSTMLQNYNIIGDD